MALMNLRAHSKEVLLGILKLGFRLSLRFAKSNMKIFGKKQKISDFDASALVVDFGQNWHDVHLFCVTHIG